MHVSGEREKILCNAALSVTLCNDLHPTHIHLLVEHYCQRTLSVKEQLLNKNMLMFHLKLLRLTIGPGGHFIIIQGHRNFKLYQMDAVLNLEKHRTFHPPLNEAHYELDDDISHQSLQHGTSGCRPPLPKTC